jgi:hypothetical protein
VTLQLGNDSNKESILSRNKSLIVFSCWSDVKQLTPKPALAKHLVIYLGLTLSHQQSIKQHPAHLLTSKIQLWTGNYRNLLQQKLTEAFCTAP